MNYYLVVEPITSRIYCVAGEEKHEGEAKHEPRSIPPAHMEERYRRGEVGASTTVCIDLIDPEVAAVSSRSGKSHSCWFANISWFTPMENFYVAICGGCYGSQVLQAGGIDTAV